MSVTFPDPETFGEPETKPHEKIDTEDYASLFDYEDTEE